MDIKLTAYSHGAGCGCKLSPAVLDQILAGGSKEKFKDLLVGNDTKDDAAVYRLDDQTSIISTTDFFMPIVDDPEDFGAIAATNAISDIYAMGGTPMMAIAILGWPINKIDPKVAKDVIQGAHQVCSKAKIPLAGGHSIDAPEPIFGLAVTGRIQTNNVKRNSDARSGDLIYLSKPLGIGLVTTAQKKGIAHENDLKIALDSMLKLNDLGEKITNLPYVHAMTDVTGFGLGGHLNEICQASNLFAEVSYDKIPVFPFVQHYLEKGTTPGGTQRNWDSYGHQFNLVAHANFRVVADPQTSGGLLITIDPNHRSEFETKVLEMGYDLQPIGRMISKDSDSEKITIS
jgi:selenide,water dikinase